MGLGKKKRENADSLLKFFKKLEKACNTYKGAKKWEIFVDELEGLIGQHPDVVPFSTFKSHLDDAKNLTDKKSPKKHAKKTKASAAKAKKKRPGKHARKHSQNKE